MPVALDVQAAIASEFRGLWNNAGQHVDLDRLAREIGAKSFWRDGWIAARRTRIYDGKAYSRELLDRLTKLEAFLRPKDLVSKAQGLVIGARGGSLDLDDFDDEEDDGVEVSESKEARRYDPARAARSLVTIRELGHDVATDDNAFRTLLPELMGSDNRISVFAEGLAAAAEQPRAMWAAIVVQFAASEQPGTSLLRGFLSELQKRDAALSEAILEEALIDSVLAPWFPNLQAITMSGTRTVARLHAALDLGKAPIHTFYSLAYGGACDDLPGPQFRDLVLAIARQPGGLPVSLEMLSMRLYAENGNKRVPPAEVLEAGRLVLSEFEFHGKGGRTVSEDFELGVVVRASLAGPEGIAVVRRLCQKMMAAAANHSVSAHDYNDLMKSLFQVHPTVVLDGLFGGDAGMQKRSVHLLRSFLLTDKTILDVVPDEVLFTWCDREPALRYPLAAAVATLFRRPEASAPHEWTPLAVKLLERGPDARLVLNEIIQRLYPSSWSGSLASKLEGRLKLLSSLPEDTTLLATAISDAKADLQARIDAERRREAQESRPRSARFE